MCVRPLRLYLGKNKHTLLTRNNSKQRKITVTTVCFFKWLSLCNYTFIDAGHLRQRELLQATTSGFFPPVVSLQMISVKLLRFSVAAARWYRWKEPLLPISYSVIREGCVGYWQLLHTTEYIIAKITGKSWNSQYLKNAPYWEHWELWVGFNCSCRRGLLNLYWMLLAPSLLLITFNSVCNSL